MLKSRDGLLVRKFGDKHIIVAIDDMADEFHSLITLNDTGLYIWKQLEEGIEYNDLLNNIINTYEIDKDTAKTDLDEFLNTAKKAGLLDE